MKKFTYLVLFFFLFSVCFLQSLVFAEDYFKIPEDDFKIEIPPEGELYKEAARKMKPFPKSLSEIREEIIEFGWQDSAEIENIIRKNKEAINLFKEATKQKSEGYIFCKKPDKLIDAPIPSYFGEIVLLKFLLLEARLYESKRQFSKAEDNYLAASRLMHHLSQQKFAALISNLVEIISFVVAYPCFSQSIQKDSFSENYYKELLENLLLIKENQDFLKNAFSDELNINKGALRMFEDKATEEGATFINLFKIEELDSTATEEQKREYKKEIEKRQPKLDSEFFSVLYAKYDSLIGPLFNAMILSSRENDLEIYKNEVNKLKVFGEQMRNPLQRLLWILKMAGSDQTMRNRLLAEYLGIICVSFSIPSYDKAIMRYHYFYNQLNNLTTAVALRLYQLDNNEFPDELGKLVPEYLDSIPEDTYNQFKPLTYKKEGKGFVVYSFGPNRKDDKAEVVFDHTEYMEDNSKDAGDTFFRFRFKRDE